MGLFFQMRPNNLTFHAWVNRWYFCERDQNPVLTGFGKILVSAGTSQQSWESWKAAKLSYSDAFMTSYEKVGLLRVCSDVCHQHLCLIEQFGHFIECYKYFLVCLQIYAVKLWMWEKDNGLSRKIRSIDQSINNWSISSIKLLINQSINQ